MIVIAEKVIHTNSNTIFNFIFDISKLSSWQSDVVSVFYITPEPIKVGSYILLTRKLFIRNVSQTFELIEVKKDLKIKLKRFEPYNSELTFYIYQIDKNISKVKIKENLELNGLIKFVYLPCFLIRKFRLNKSLNKLTKLLD